MNCVHLCSQTSPGRRSWGNTVGGRPSAATLWGACRAQRLRPAIERQTQECPEMPRNAQKCPETLRVRPYPPETRKKAPQCCSRVFLGVSVGLWPVSLDAGQTLAISGFAAFNGRLRAPVASVRALQGGHPPPWAAPKAGGGGATFDLRMRQWS